MGARCKRRCALYRAFGAGHKLLYIGIAEDPLQRFVKHCRGESGWATDLTSVKIVWYPTRDAAHAAERAAITAEDPVWNIRHSPHPDRGRQLRWQFEQARWAAEWPPGDDVWQRLAVRQQEEERVREIVQRALYACIPRW